VIELHCWEFVHTDAGDLVGICLLPLGHRGPCALRPISDVRVTFLPTALEHLLHEEAALGAVGPPLDQLKRAAGDPVLPGLEP